MLRKILAIVAIVLGVGVQADAQVQQTVPRIRITFDGSTTVNSMDFGGWMRWRTASATPAVSAAGEVRLYFDGTKLKISENGGAYQNLTITGGAGTVTSVGLSAPGIFSVSGSPVTGSGTLTFALANQTGSTVFASPAGGGSGTPLFRALQASDFGTGVINSTAILDGTIAFGDIGANSCAANQIMKRNAGNTAWACAADDTSVGGTSWVTNGNALTGTGLLGSSNSFNVALMTANTTRLLLNTSGDAIFTSDRTGTAPGLGAWWLQPSSNATSGVTTYSSPRLNFIARGWSGSASADFGYFVENQQLTGTTHRFRVGLVNGDTTMFSLDESGNARFTQAVSANSYSTDTAYRFQASSTGVSASGQGALRYSSTTNSVEVSNNGGAWTPIGTTTASTYLRLLPRDAVLPDASFATINVRNAHQVIEFDDSSTESAYFEDIMPNDYDGGSATLRCFWTSNVLTGNVRWRVNFERMDSAGLDLDVDSFSTDVLVTSASQATSGLLQSFSTSVTNGNMDAVSASDHIRVRVSRLGADAADTMTGFAQFVGCEVRK